ncbi:elongation factor Ts, mitochondrial-like [Miscanthus floridulus]|uniref:elongation factor Ts, mitochondrial-like n=1 Tax=Miscanthus floridulus TaxID=154761 RepID=UPI00345AF3CE
MACGQGAKKSILGLLFRAQQQTARAYSSSAFQTHQLSTHVPQDGVFFRRFSSEVSSSEQMNLIKQLRQRTSAPIKDVKASLVACNWDIEAAQKDLRKRGVALAAKKSSRTAAEGLLAIAQDDKRAAVVELNCETDFVARNDVFQYLASSLAKMALSSQGPGELFMPFGPELLENMSINLDHPMLSGETTVQSAVTEVAAMVGENVKLRRGFMLSTTLHGVVSSYMHTCPQPGMGRIAGLVTLEAEDSSTLLDAVKSVGSSIAMQIVATKPLFLSKELVSASALENEREILRTQAESSGKSQMAMDKMVEGRLRKYFEEVVLMEQKYVLNDNTNVKTVLNDLSKEVGSKVTIGNFIRMEVGEGMERTEAADDSEVAAGGAM